MSRRSSPQFVHRKTLPIKRNDAEPLVRSDLQYDLLYHIFSDTHPVFTDSHPTLRGDPPGTKVTFHDLYVNALVRSPRASKVLKEKMLDTPEFGTDFAKLALLANVGRINTTMAFFPEMKTAIRTYHPIPALQKTNGNLQDAPRIKNILKSCLLDGETKEGVPSTPVDILSRSRSGKIPPTSVVNLIFVMANHATPLAQMHFDNTLDFLDLFLPIHFSSSSRARAFLWLMYHYLELPSAAIPAPIDDDDYDGDGTSTPAVNPFSDKHALLHPGKIPLLKSLTPEEMELENVDCEEEKLWGEKMLLQRKEFQAKMDRAKDNKRVAAAAAEEGGNSAGPSGEGAEKPKLTPKEKKAAADKARRERQRAQARLRENPPAVSVAEVPVAKAEDQGDKSMVAEPASTSFPPIMLGPQAPERERYPLHVPHSTQHHLSQHSHPRSRRINTPESPSARYNPYKLTPVSSIPDIGNNNHGTVKVTAPHLPHRSRHRAHSTRTMLQHAWHIVTTTDPLHDSDEEPDEHVRVDYARRLNILSRLRGKEPTPEPDFQTTQSLMDVDTGMGGERMVRPS